MSVSALLLARRLSWLLVVVLVFSAGCSGEGPVAQPPERPAPRTSPVATTEPTPEPPDLPAAAQQNTKAGAVAFAKHYVGLVNHAAVSGDTAGLTAVSRPECRGCTGLVRSIRGVYADGGWIRTEGWQILSWSSPGAENAQERVVTLRVRMPSERRKSSSGAEVEVSDPTAGVVNMQIEHGARGWLMVEMGLL